MNGQMRIERASNGYVVRVDDPKIVKENSKPNSRWKDPTCEYIFKTVDEVKEFIGKNIEKALPADEYSSSFDAALDEDDD